MTEDRELPSNLQGAVFFQQGRDRMPDCARHGETHSERLKLNNGGEILVTKDDIYLHFCPECLIKSMDEVAPIDIHTVDQALELMLMQVFGSDGGLTAQAEFMQSLGPGEISHGDVRLAETPPLDAIPEWLLDEGLYFIEESEREPVDQAYRREFREKFGREPSVLSEDTTDSDPNG